MNIDDLVKAVETWNPTDEEIACIQERWNEMEAVFEKEAKKRQITQEWLNKEYTL